jgi:hypothetical protein
VNLIESQLPCPYCGEVLTVLVDPSVETQEYVEDCHVCCSPIVIDVEVSGEDIVAISARQENC